MRRAWLVAGLLVLAGTLAGGAAGAAQETPVNPQKPVSSQTPVDSPGGPEVEACRATGLVAIKERDATIKDIFLDPDGLTIAKANTKVEDTPIRTIVMGDAYLQKTKGEKPYRFLCLVGEKGKVVLTFFTDH